MHKIMITGKSSNETQGNYINPFLAKVTELKIRNFKAKLPDDFVKMLSVTTMPKEKIAPIISGTINDWIIEGHRKISSYDTFMHIPTCVEIQYRSGHIMNRAYRIKEDEILTIGSYSKFFLFRWIQKLMEHIKPEKIIIKYINSEQHHSHFR